MIDMIRKGFILNGKFDFYFKQMFFKHTIEDKLTL